MQPIPFNMKGTEYAITIKVATYSEGNLAIKLYQENFGQLIFWDTPQIWVVCGRRTVVLSTQRPLANGFMHGLSATD